MGIKEAGISLLLITIFSFALISMAVSFADNNNAAINIGDDSGFNDIKTEYETNAASYSVEINGTSTSYSEAQIEAGSESIVSGNPFKPKVLSNMFGTFTNIFGLIHERIFGGSAAFGAILTMITTVFILLIIWWSWKLWKGGNPD